MSDSAKSTWGDPCRVCLQTGGHHWTVPHVDQSPVVAQRRLEEFRNGLTERERETFDWVLSATIWHAVRTETERAERLIRQHLLFSSQRAVSWHEVQDCLEALRREPPAESNSNSLSVQRRRHIQQHGSLEGFRGESADKAAIMCTEPGSRAGSVCLLLLGHCGAHNFQTFRPL